MESDIDRLSLTEGEELYKIQECNLDESQGSPFSKSRYGRTRKPKISQDFYDIDAIFDTVKESKKSPRLSHPVKTPSTSKVLKAKSNHSLIDDEDVKKDSKAVFIHVTADSELEDIPLPPSPVVKAVDSPKIVKKIQMCETEVSPKISTTDSADPIENSLTTNLSTSLHSEDTLNNIDAPEVLKINTPAELDNEIDESAVDVKCDSKPALKTYANKRKCFSKFGIVESFALPDKPIFPQENDGNTQNEPKRYKDLDVVPSASGIDVNLTDKSLLNTPWKIASINTDMSTSETLLDPAYDDVGDNRLEDDMLIPVSTNIELVTLEDNVCETTEIEISPEEEEVQNNEGIQSTLDENIECNIVGVIETNDTQFAQDVNEITLFETISKPVEVSEKSHVSDSSDKNLQIKDSSDSAISKSKSRHKHKSSSKHRHKDTSDSDTKLPSNTDTVISQHKHKPSKNKDRHRTKQSNEVVRKENVTKADELVPKTADVKKTEKSKKHLKEKSSDALQIVHKNTKEETAVSIASTQHSTEKLPENTSHAHEKSDKSAEIIKTVGSVKKHEAASTSVTKSKTSRKNTEILVSKKRKTPSDFLKIFEKPLFSVPDGTIRQVPSTSVKEKTKREGSSSKDTNDDFKRKTNEIEKADTKTKHDAKSKITDKAGSTKNATNEKLKDDTSVVESKPEKIKKKKHSELPISTSKAETKTKTSFTKTGSCEESSIVKQTHRERISDINKNDTIRPKSDKTPKLPNHPIKDNKQPSEKPDKVSKRTELNIDSKIVDGEITTGKATTHKKSNKRVIQDDSKSLETKDDFICSVFGISEISKLPKNTISDNTQNIKTSNIGTEKPITKSATSVIIEHGNVQTPPEKIHKKHLNANTKTAQKRSSPRQSENVKMSREIDRTTKGNKHKEAVIINEDKKSINLENISLGQLQEKLGDANNIDTLNRTKGIDPKATKFLLNESTNDHVPSTKNRKKSPVRNVIPATPPSIKQLKVVLENQDLSPKYLSSSRDSSLTKFSGASSSNQTTTLGKGETPKISKSLKVTKTEVESPRRFSRRSAESTPIQVLVAQTKAETESGNLSVELSPDRLVSTRSSTKKSSDLSQHVTPKHQNVKIEKRSKSLKTPEKSANSKLSIKIETIQPESETRKRGRPRKISNISVETVKIEKEILNYKKSETEVPKKSQGQIIKDAVDTAEVSQKQTRRGRPRLRRLSDSNMFTQSMIELNNKEEKKLRPVRSSVTINTNEESLRSSRDRQRRAVSVCFPTKDNSHSKNVSKVKAEPLPKRSKRFAQDKINFNSTEELNESRSSLNLSRQKEATQKQRASSIDRKPVSTQHEEITKECTVPNNELADMEYRFAPTNVKIGDLMWGRIGNYPYWPCLITKDPETNLYEKTIGAGNRSYLSYHVRFYGDRGRRSWIYGVYMMRFYNKDDIQKASTWFKALGKTANVQACVVKSSILSNWEIAVKEAHSMISKSVEERLEFFFNMFNTSFNTKKKRRPSTSSEEEYVAKPKISRISSRQSRSPVKADSSVDRAVRSKSLPACSTKSYRNIRTEEKSAKKPAEYKPVSELKKVSSSPLAKFSKINEKSEVSELLPVENSQNSLLNVQSDKKDLDKVVPEANSECSLSDSDTVSKSSSSTVVPSNFHELIMRRKKNNLFKGISKHRVCQICRKFSEVFKCQGPCNGLFHHTCAKNMITKQSTPLLDDTTPADESINDQNSSNEDNTIVQNLKASDIVSSSADQIPLNKNHNVNSDQLEVDLILSVPKSVDYSIAEQIDLKMKEIMSLQDNYADSTTDYTSSEETYTINNSASENSPKKKSLKLKNVTADHTGLSKESLVKSSKVQDCASASCSNTTKDDFKCQRCSIGLAPPCFICETEVSSKNVAFRQKCSLKVCGRYYHPHCLKIWPQTQWSLISTVKDKDSDQDLETFVCPAHVCHTCSSDNPRVLISRCRSDQTVRCLHCPATYHSTNYCVPAGTYILSTTQIICPRHFLQKESNSKKTNFTRTVNTPWCFICSKGGDLVCCETCPTSVHTDCLHVNFLDDGTFSCEDCETGRFPLYDEIVWVKLGHYRWWPATILFPNEIPENIKNVKHTKGEFVVKFFGTHDHHWVSRGRVFLFQEGDRPQSTTSKTKVDIAFRKSVEEAAMAHELKNAFAVSMKAEIQTDNKPPPYIRIKNNKPVGTVRSFDANVSNKTPCECTPVDRNPCGADSDCLNRILLTECDPNICPAKDKCNNQRFEKRQYPPLVPYKTESRGWGLKTLAPIRRGEFVIEYVGELIDEQEYQRRIRKMHEQKDENYYFLTIDCSRIIDAGPKGNLARFMNHCCQPNCETQKWTVNGDTRVGLFALADIPIDSEVTFNYQLQCIGKEKKICACGAPNCTGFIGVTAKLDESQKRLKKTPIKRKRGYSTPAVSKNDGPCFVCGQSGNVGACHNKICNKLYHLKCVNLKLWPDGKWACPWHNCNICGKRTIRCCVQCINSYCPAHAEGNTRYDNLLGFVCSDHDPTKESHELSTENSIKTSTNVANIHTEESDVTSTTLDDSDNIQSNKNIDKTLEMPALPQSNSTPIQKEKFTSFVDTLEAFEKGFTAEDFKTNLKQGGLMTYNAKRKRGSQKKSIGNSAKKIKLSNEVIKPTPNYSASLLLDIPAHNEIKLSSTVPTRHLRTTRKVSTESEIKQLIKRQNEYEKGLPIRKRTRPRCEVNL